MSRLSTSDLMKIPGFQMPANMVETAPSEDAMRAAARNSYLIVGANIVWLLIPLIGLITNAGTHVMFGAMVLAMMVLFGANVYTGRKWYFYVDFAKGTPLEAHYARIDHLGFRAFFGTLISVLLFLIASVMVTNLIKSEAGGWIVLGLNVALTVFMTGLGVWIGREVVKGLAALKA